MSAAKKITFGRKNKKAPLAEVVPIQEETEILPEEPVEMPEEPAVDLSGLAQSLTRPQGLTDAEVEARLAYAPEAADMPESGDAPCPPEPETDTAGRDMSTFAVPTETFTRYFLQARNAHFVSPEGYSNRDYLRRLCGNGLSERYDDVTPKGVGRQIGRASCRERV